MMTVAQLIKRLEALDGAIDVLMYDHDFNYCEESFDVYTREVSWDRDVVRIIPGGERVALIMRCTDVLQ